ncbi:MAG: hypothetical protein V4603_11810 [Pseudomonadota bacterium]
MTQQEQKLPWHVLTVAILTLLWNGSGAYTIILAQQGQLQGMRADEVEYYASQALWFVIVTDIALFAPLAAAIALILRSGAAARLFALGLGAVLITNCYDLIAGSSRALANPVAATVTGIIIVIAILQLVYAMRMKKRGVLV